MLVIFLLKNHIRAFSRGDHVHISMPAEYLPNMTLCRFSKDVVLAQSIDVHLDVCLHGENMHVAYYAPDISRSFKLFFLNSD